MAGVGPRETPPGKPAVGRRSPLAIPLFQKVEPDMSEKEWSPAVRAAERGARSPGPKDGGPFGHLLPLSFRASTTQPRLPDPLSSNPGSTLGSQNMDQRTNYTSFVSGFFPFTTHPKPGYPRNLVAAPGPSGSPGTQRCDSRA